MQRNLSMCIRQPSISSVLYLPLLGKCACFISIGVLLEGPNQQNPRVCKKAVSVHNFFLGWTYHYTPKGLFHIHWCLHGETTQQNLRVCRTHPSIHQFLLCRIYHCSIKGPPLLLWGTMPLLLSWWDLWKTQKRALVRASYKWSSNWSLPISQLLKLRNTSYVFLKNSIFPFGLKW